MNNQVQLESSSNQDHQQSSTNTFDIPFAYRVKQYKPKTIMEKVSYMLIRPPRFVYNEKLLLLGKKNQQKFSYEVHNVPFPVSIYWADEPKYIILYLHGNSSSRFQGYLHLSKLPQGACLACFDFDGCGLRRQSDFITLGKKQSKQVNAVTKYLKQFGLPVIGWGRSMGAVSLLLSNQCDIMITDSPFSSLYDLCKQTSTNATPKVCCCFIHCFFPCVFWCVRNSVEQLSGMDPNQIEVIHAVQNQDAKKKILMLAGKNDTMIHYSHSQRLFEAFRGTQKKLILFQGTHNSNRPQQVLDQCFKFIDKNIQNFSYTNKNNISETPQNLIGKLTSKSQVTIIKVSQCPKNKSTQYSMVKQSNKYPDKIIQLQNFSSTQRNRNSKKQTIQRDVSEQDINIKKQSVQRMSFKQVSRLNMLMNLNKKQKFLPPLGEGQISKSKLFNVSNISNGDDTQNMSLQTSGMPMISSKIQQTNLQQNSIQQLKDQGDVLEKQQLHVKIKDMFKIEQKEHLEKNHQNNNQKNHIDKQSKQSKQRQSFGKSQNSNVNVIKINNKLNGESEILGQIQARIDQNHQNQRGISQSLLNQESSKIILNDKSVPISRINQNTKKLQQQLNQNEDLGSYKAFIKIQQREIKQTTSLNVQNSKKPENSHIKKDKTVKLQDISQF